MNLIHLLLILQLSFAGASGAPCADAFAHLSPQVRDNPQMEIWKLRTSRLDGEATRLEDQILQSMRSSPIRKDSIKATSEGQYGAKYVQLENGLRGVWKPSETEATHGADTLERGMNREVAVSLVDRKLGFDLVPLTIEKELNGKVGSLQLEVTQLDRLQYQEHPANFSFFDYLIGNKDRHDENILSSGRRPIAIDHGGAFHPDEPHAFFEYWNTALENYDKAKTAKAKNAAREKLKELLPPKDVYERLVHTSRSDWQKLLQTYLKEDEIEKFLRRRLELVTSVDSIRQEMGDEIFPTALKVVEKKMSKKKMMKP